MVEQIDQKVDPKLQEQFDMFVINGMNIIHDEQVSNSILNRILQSDDPVTAIADATLDIVNRIYESAVENGIQLMNETLVYGSNILMGEIISMAESAGMQKMTEEQRSASYELATSKYLDNAVKTGRLKKEELVGMAEQVPKGQIPEGGM